MDYIMLYIAAAVLMLEQLASRYKKVAEDSSMLLYKYQLLELERRYRSSRYKDMQQRSVRL